MQSPWKSIISSRFFFEEFEKNIFFENISSIFVFSIFVYIIGAHIRHFLFEPSATLEYDMSVSAVLGDFHLFRIIKEFYGTDSYLYLGCLNKSFHEAWQTNSHPKTSPKYAKRTSKHMVTESRRRISRLVHETRVEGNLLITQCMRAAAWRGDLRGVIRVRLYAKRRGLRLASRRVVPMMDAAARSGSVELLEYFKKGYYAMGVSTMVEAVHAPNSVEVIRWLMKNKCELDEDAEVEAAKTGNIPALRVFSQVFKFRGFSEKVMTYSGLSGSRDTVNVLHESGCNLDASLISMAALKGHLDLVKYLRGLGCPWDPRVCWMSAYGGHLEVLEWARSQNPPCPWNSLTFKVAVDRKHKRVVEYTKANNCPGSKKRRRLNS
ncbi:unnamed protein product [Sphacelaria rigidula]